MKHSIIAIALLAASAAAHADDVSKNAGVCSAYKTAREDHATARRAYNTATNKALAQNVARTWYKELIAADSSTRGGLISEGVQACASIGIQ